MVCGVSDRSSEPVRHQGHQGDGKVGLLHSHSAKKLLLMELQRNGVTEALRQRSSFYKQGQLGGLPEVIYTRDA